MIKDNELRGSVIFRTAKKGYERSDVHSYIENMSIRFTARESELKAEIAKLKKMFEEASDHSDRDGELSSLREENEILKADITSLKAELAARPTEAPISADDKEKADCEEPDLRTISEKLGNIILKANLDAEKIISDAEAEAEKQRSKAQKDAEGIMFDAAVSARLMSAKVKERLVSLTDEYVAALKSSSVDSISEYKRIYDELEAKFGDIVISKDLLN